MVCHNLCLGMFTISNPIQYIARSDNYHYNELNSNRPRGYIIHKRKTITHLRFADDIYGLAWSESELGNLINKIDAT